GAPGADLGQLLPQVVDGLVDAPLEIFQYVIGHAHVPSLVRYAQAVSFAPTTVPISPGVNTARRMLPRPVRSKTTIGSLLSMQSEIAVESITFRRCLSTSMYVSVL